jgi:hypothetical protein
LAATADTLLAKINLTWQDNSLVEQGYKIYYSTVNTKPSAPQLTLPANSVSAVITHLLPQTTYYFWVESYFGDTSSLSAAAQAVTRGKFTLQRWATQMGGYWDEIKWVSGDFNGDGKCDLAAIYNDGGSTSIAVRVSDGTKLTGIQQWAVKQGGFYGKDGANTRRWVAGDFNGDGYLDLASVYSTSDNHVRIEVHYGNGHSFDAWGLAVVDSGWFVPEQKWLAADFDGDGKSDIAMVWNYQGNAMIDMYRGTSAKGSGGIAAHTGWASYQGAFFGKDGADTRRWVAGDFNGDGHKDLASVYSKSDNHVYIDVHYGNGSSFYTWGQALGDGTDYFAPEQFWIAGDFNRDGKTDIANVWNYLGKTKIDGYCGTSVTDSGGIAHHTDWGVGYQGEFNNTCIKRWFSGDFNGDGLCDIGEVFNENGKASVDIHLASYIE